SGESMASTSAQLPAAVGVPNPIPIFVVDAGAGRSPVSVTSTDTARAMVKLCALTPSRSTDPSNLAATLEFVPLDRVVMAPQAARRTAPSTATRLVDSMKILP